MKNIVWAGIALFCFGMGIWVHAATPAPEGAQVYIITPSEGEVVKSPVTVEFGLKNMGVAPAGIDKANTGHHHLLIDMAELPPLDKPLVGSEQLIHFGGGQTQVAVDLPPGKHTLQLILGDMTHTPHDPPVISKKVNIEVR